MSISISACIMDRKKGKTINLNMKRERERDIYIYISRLYMPMMD